MNIAWWHSSRHPQADYRPEEGRASWRAEPDDRRAHVPAGQRQRLLALGLDLLIPPRVSQRVGQVRWQARLGEQRLGEGEAAPDGGRQLGDAGGVEYLAADRLVERSDSGPPVLGPCPRRDPQQPQPRGVPLLVAGREVDVVVDAGVDHPQRDEPPVNGVVALRGDHAQPLAGHPGEGAHRVEVEPDVRVRHAFSRHGQAVAAGVCSRK